MSASTRTPRCPTPLRTGLGGSESRWSPCREQGSSRSACANSRSRSGPEDGCNGCNVCNGPDAPEAPEAPEAPSLRVRRRIEVDPERNDLPLAYAVHLGHLAAERRAIARPLDLVPRQRDGAIAINHQLPKLERLDPVVEALRAGKVRRAPVQLSNGARETREYHVLGEQVFHTLALSQGIEVGLDRFAGRHCHRGRHSYGSVGGCSAR